jgi:hypothetical protein
MKFPEHLKDDLSMLRRAFPDGVPGDDYMALLAVLQDDSSERNLAILVAELIGGEDVVVANDAAAATSIYKPRVEDVNRVRHLLLQHGWMPEDDGDVGGATAGEM